MLPIGNDWDALLAPEFEKPYFQKLLAALDEEYAAGPVYPPREDVFNALRATAFADVKAVILGQDPYHGPGQAHGLCFSVQPGVKVPPSLRNIFKECEADLGLTPPAGGTLTPWAAQGVLLLNTVLTVREGKPNSHKRLGWTTFTDHIISLLGAREKPLVFLLWGGNARSKAPLITAPQHLILETVHPSPLSAYQGFFGCRHFSKCNAFLTENGQTPIDWSL